MLDNVLDKFIGFFQKPTHVLTNGVEIQHKDYSTVKKGKNFALPIERNVINQSIINKYDFIEFINEYKNDQTKIFYTENIVQAIFNYPTVEKADHEDSYVRMELQKTKDFIVFQSSLEDDLTQKQLIRILKRLEPCIVGFDNKKVDDMDIIEVAENLQSTKNIQSVQRNSSQAFMIDAEVKAGNGNFTVPRYINFEMPIYKNDLKIIAKFDVELFLSANEGNFTANLVCYKLEQTLEETVRELTKQVCEGCEGVESFMV